MRSIKRIWKSGKFSKLQKSIIKRWWKLSNRVKKWRNISDWTKRRLRRFIIWNKKFNFWDHKQTRRSKWKSITWSPNSSQNQGLNLLIQDLKHLKSQWSLQNISNLILTNKMKSFNSNRIINSRLRSRNPSRSKLIFKHNFRQSRKQIKTKI